MRWYNYILDNQMNKTSLYEFCIVVPVYNEEDNMVRLESELAKYASVSSVKSCIMFVDDGSKDNSLNLIREACERHEQFYYISFEKNAGLSAAIKAGIEQTESPFVGYIDADLQTSPEDFELLLPYRNEFAIVMGIRQVRNDSLVKRLSSKIANGFRRMMTKDGVEDTGCPLKILKTEYAKRIPFFKGMHRFMPALILLQAGGNVKQVPVRHFPREAGTSKFNMWNRLTGPFMDCFAYRWMKRRYLNYKIGEDNILE